MSISDIGLEQVSDIDSDDVVGTLYVVATPIGNLGDLTRRAEDVLKTVEIVAAEDTRRTSVLLEHIGHRAPELVSYHEHNKASMTTRLVERLLGGQSIALVSDAGTPLINDPGADLVAAAFDNHLPVIPVPGVSALTAALSVCPFPSYPFRYIGFLPPKVHQRTKVLEACLAQGDAFVCFEAPHRVTDTLRDLAALTEREVMVGRELTKKYETIEVGSAESLLDRHIEPRGEFVLIISAGKTPGAGEAEQERVLKVLLAYMSPAQAAKAGAAILGSRKNELYGLALKLRESN